MSTLIEEEDVESAVLEPAQQLRSTMTAMRLSFTWFGTRKTLSPEQKERAAESFGADGPFLSAGKKLIDTDHPSFKAVTAARHQAVAYWKGMSLPYPDNGIRLIRQGDLEDVNERMTTLQAELHEAVAALDESYHELKVIARDKLGSLYNDADYPATLRGCFDLSWDFPSVEPPDYLRRLSPQVYRQQCQRVAARFDEAVQLAEQTFVEELSRLVSHLVERLSGQDDGKPKVFRDSAVENLTTFFERFRRLNVSSNGQLEDLVAQAQQVVSGNSPQSLRDDRPLAQRVATELSGVQSVLDGLLVDRPRRRLLRRPK